MLNVPLEWEFFISTLGEIIDAKHRCKKCKGKKVVQESKVLEVNVMLSEILLLIGFVGQHICR